MMMIIEICHQKEIGRKQNRYREKREMFLREEKASSLKYLDRFKNTHVFENTRQGDWGD